MLMLILFLSCPILAGLTYLALNIASLWKKAREFQRITELLVLEDQLERMIAAGQEAHPTDVELQRLGRNLIGNFRLDVQNQVKGARNPTPTPTTTPS